MDKPDDLALDRMNAIASDSCEDERVREAARNVIEGK
jgi:hypothetical protein